MNKTDGVILTCLSYNPESGVITWIKGRGPVKAGATAGYTGSNGQGKQYLEIRANRKTLLAHRVAWFLHYGHWPIRDIDHINGDGTDNRIQNLREVTKKQNNENRRLPVNNKSGFMGVFFNKKDSIWHARARKDGKQIHLGSFESLIDAIAARIRANKEFGYHENHGSVRDL